ncbi:MAG: hypothetical protein E6J29_10875 [Chloroflexi bacterium]|nr:MAG: hypothetical protein E6J29_10875 [Chloroflexota bacterium]
MTLAEELGRADLKLRTAEFVMIQVAFMLGWALLGLFRFGFAPHFVVAGVVGYFIPMRYLRYRQRRRQRTLSAQLPDTISLLTNALKAGYSFPQAIDTVARNGSPPIAEEFGRVVRELNLGGSVEQSLNNLVKRAGNDDLELVVTAAVIQNQVGGNLARILDNISDTIRERDQLDHRPRTRLGVDHHAPPDRARRASLRPHAGLLRRHDQDPAGRSAARRGRPDDLPRQPLHTPGRAGPAMNLR